MVIHDEVLIRKMKLKARGLRHDHSLSKFRICKIIAGEYGLPLDTVRYYVYRRKNKNRYDSYDKNYDLKYKRLIRHIDSVFPQIFNGNSGLQLKEISSRIENLAGISLKEGTLEKLIGKYQGMPQGPPIIKTETGNYKLNDSYYISQN